MPREEPQLPDGVFSKWGNTIITSQKTVFLNGENVVKGSIFDEFADF